MAKTQGNNPRGGSGVDRLREELSSFLSAQVGNSPRRRAEADRRPALTDGTSGGSLPAIGSRVLQGESPAEGLRL